MTTMSESTSPRIRARRVAMVVGAMVAFAVVARVMQPGASQATGPGTAEGAVIGTLVGPQYHVRITASSDAPRYTVLSPDGNVLEADLLAHEVYHFFPELDVTKLHFGDSGTVSGPLMLADPE
jgi:hypothetical protein